MEREKIIFAFLACVLLAGLAFLALGALPKQPVPFFAYGTNLAKSTLSARAGGFINATEAQASGYSLAFASQDTRPTEFGVATLVENGSGTVSGAIYYLTPEEMAALDKQSGVPNFYLRKEVAVSLPDGSIAKAQAYFLPGGVHPAPPARTYYIAAQNGMKEWGYDAGSLDAAVAEAAGSN